MKICLFGSFTHLNFGDQLLAETIIDWLDSRYRGLEIVLPFSREGFCRTRPGLRVTYGGGFPALEGCNAAVFSGGGYFGERKHTTKGLDQNLSWRWYTFRNLIQSTLLFIKFWRFSRRLLHLGIPYVILGPGVGPVTTFLGRKAVRDSLEGARLAIVRDNESMDWANRIAPKAKVIPSVDNILALIVDEPRPLKRYRSLGFHWGPITNRYTDSSLLKDLLQRLMGTGLKIYLLSDTHPGGDPSREFEAYAPLPKELLAKAVFVPYRNTSQLMGDIRKKYDMVLSTKLHVCITSYALGKMPLSVAVHSKAKRFYRQAGLENNCFEFSEEGLALALARIGKIRKDPKAAVRSLKAERKRLRRTAMQNRHLLYRFLDPIIHPGEKDR